jgi:Tol biopolymer transport system component
MTSERQDETKIGDSPKSNAGVEIGTQVGSYHIDARLGEGGMGIVYRATDTKLNRPVAIKFLADNLFDANARRRFQREAQMASGLNHPHIVTVYDVGEYADRQYLVTELVDGGTLQDWADAEPHRWRQVVELMVGVADALAAAHAASILHRDVKPTNILISKNGYAKLADFGLAKLVEDSEASRASGARHTATGAVVGTAAYMSPEQAMGRPLDARSDIFTFGVVLYELLAGRHPFAGESDIVMLQAVIHAQPPPLPDEIPEALKTVVEKALEKEPAERYQSMRELVVDLRRIARKSSADRPPVASAAPRRSRAWIPWTAVALTLVALLGVGTFAIMRGRSVGPGEPTEFVILPPADAAFSNNPGSIAAISPDGRQIAFVAVSADGVARLWVRSLGSLNARQLPGTDDANGPFWSPDGRSLGFFARGKLRRVDAAGGAVQTLADVSLPLGGSWSRAGVIVYAPAPGGPLLAIAASGGAPKTVTHYESGQLAHLEPRFLPDGRHFLYAYLSSLGEAHSEVASLDSTDATSPLGGAVGALYAAPGYLLFVRSGTLMAQRFDAANLALSGDPTPIVDAVSTATTPDASDNGTLVYRSGGATLTQLLWLDRSGRTTGVAAPAAVYHNIALSADGTRVAFDREGSTTQDVWILDLERGVTSRLTFATGFSNVPLWSPDGRTVAFASLHDGIDIYRRASNFSGSDEPLAELHANAIMFPSDWSSDGRYLTYYRTMPDSRLDEWVLPLDGGEPRALLHEPFSESQAQFSPNGRWLAYVSDESGVPQIYVQSFPGLSGKWQVSNAGGTQPRWAHDGTELYYLAPDRKLMAVSVTTGDTFEVRGTEALFATSLDVGDQRQTYSVAPDGRFLLNVPVGTSTAPLTVVLNWPALLKK